jgi:4-amino-4-deoxy-L-arabinose transferase-like glycosyltransferase
VWRVLYVRAHDPRKFVWSDMGFYFELARRIGAPDYVLTASDVTHPPGVPVLLAWLGRLDASLGWAVGLQLAIALLVPFAVAAVAWLAFGAVSARWALVASSFYYPFFDYAGYFLAEIYMVLLVPATVALLLAAVRARGRRARIGFALGAGVALSGGMAMKAVMLPAVMAFGLVYALFGAAPRKHKAAVLLAVALGALPAVGLLSHRCTRASGSFCLVSNKAAADFLLGHYGRIRGITWRPPAPGSTFGFGSPSAHQHGYTEQPEVPFAMTDGPRNMAAAWGWIRANPSAALLLSLEHVFDLFVGSVPWPSCATVNWRAALWFHMLFIVLILLPCAILFFDLGRVGGFRALLASRELLVVSPIFGLMAAAFIATGEPRYRIPFDTLLIVVAVELYRRHVFPPAGGGADPTGSGRDDAQAAH